MYAKLFRSMYDGSLCTRGPWQALVTFQQLLVLADRYGACDMTVEAIARTTTVPIEVIQAGIEALSQADPDSRRADHDGKRIIPIDPARSWGWQVVNYEHYRKIRSAEERREYQRQLMQKRRAQPEAGATIERIPLRDSTEFEVRESFVAELDRLYANVDPLSTLREIRGWCIGNPAKLKTRAGVRRFITGWFKREQDKYVNAQK